MQILVYPFFVVLLASCFLSKPTELFGGMYMVSSACIVMKIILAFVLFIVLIISPKWLEEKSIRNKAGEYYELLIMTLLGLYSMLSSGHFLFFFLGLELATIPMACLIAIDRFERHSAEAAAKFILLAIFSGAVMLYGISFIYAACGTMYFDDISKRITDSPMSIMGMVFFFSGLGFKISLVPFHLWTADTYQGAPTPITAYMSIASKGAAAFALIVFLIRIFFPLVFYWEWLLTITVTLSITIANLTALRQKELKRFMAFSSISQAGYIMLATCSAREAGIVALEYYVLVYAVANLVVFTIIHEIEFHRGDTLIYSYEGLYQTNPKLSFLLTLALFSLAGIPPFAGMFSKFFVFMASVRTGEPVAYILLFIALINTVISLYYYLMIVKAMYITPSEHPLPTFRTSWNIRLALALCTIGVVCFGFCSFFYEWIAEGVKGI